MNYRRKDYVFPRSMREAFGDDPSEPAELKCLTWHTRPRRPLLPAIMWTVAGLLALWQVLVVWGR